MLKRGGMCININQLSLKPSHVLSDLTVPSVRRGH